MQKYEVPDFVSDRSPRANTGNEEKREDIVEIQQNTPLEEA